MTPVLKRLRLHHVLPALLLAGLAVPPLAGADSALRSVMHTWKRDLRTSDAMLSGRAGFDANAMRAILAAYADDSARIAARITGQSSDARDIRRRFEVLQADARAALQHAGQPDALRGDIRHIAATCQACHDIYN